MNEKQEFVESWRMIIKHFLPELTEEEVEERIAEGLRLKFGADFLNECEKEFEAAEESGDLHTLMSQSVLSIRAEHPAKQKDGGD